MNASGAAAPPKPARLEIEQQRNVLRIARRVSATIGRDFFAAIVEHLAAALEVDWSYIAEMVDFPGRKLRTVAVWHDGALVDNFDLDLSGSAARQALSDGSLAWSKDARQIFPEDSFLGRAQVEAIVALRLSDSAGQVVGIMALAHPKPISQVPLAKSLLEAFAARAAAELERKRGEDALRESEQRYRAFVSSNADAMWRVEFVNPIPLTLSEDEQVERIYRDGYIAEGNEAFARNIGAASAEELAGAPFSSLFPPSDDRLRHELRAAVRAGYDSSTHLTTPIGPDGRKCYRLRTQHGIVEKGELQRIWGTTRDVTEWKLAELAAEASERRFRDVLQNITAPAVMLDGYGAVTFCNDALLALTEAQGDRLTGSNWLELFPESPQRDRWSALLARNEGAAAAHFEEVLHFTGAAPRRLAWNAIRLRDDNGDGAALAAIGADVTDQRTLEQCLAQSEKLAGIGRLAAGIAHDFNNLLALIIGYVGMALEKVDSSAPVHSTLLSVQSAANDCALLTSQLLAIGRRQHLHPELISLNSVISADEDVLHQILGPDVDLVCNLDPGLGLVRADPVQARRIIANLATNARDAMPQGGTFTITTVNTDISAEDVPGRLPGAYVAWTLADTGTGVSEEIRSHLFEPFYTTKPRGKGAGLGLSTVYGIVTQSGGHISVRSETGAGTAIEILLPRFAPVQ